MTAKVRATAKLTDAEIPDNFDPEASAWNVTLRYQGRRLTVPFFTGSMAGKPTAKGVLECLILDAEVEDWTFDDWCADFGYDTDSRRAYRMYQACKEQTEKLRKLLGDDFDAAMTYPEWAEEHSC